MRNKGFFWFFTILLVAVSIYQISFSFIGNSIEEEAEQLAIERAEELKAKADSGEVQLPNGTYINFEENNEAFAIAKAAYINEILKEKNDEEIFLGNTFKEVKEKSVSLGLDLKGGMSVTLQLSMPELIKNVALNPRDLHFIKPFEAAVEDFDGREGDFIDLFAKKHKELYPDRKLIREFSTEKVITEISNKAADEDVKSYLRGLVDGAMDGVETIMENRINQFGVAQPNITQDDNLNRLYIELPGVKDQETMRAKISATANLEFYQAAKLTELGQFFNNLLVEKSEEVDDDEFDELFKDDSTAAEGDSISTAEMEGAEEPDSIDTTASLGDELAAEDKESPEDTSSMKLTDFGKMFQVNIDEENQFRPVPSLGFASAGDTASINDILDKKAKEMMMDNINFVWSSDAFKSASNDSLYYTLYALIIPEDGKARVGGNDISEARVTVNPDNGKIAVSLDMNDRGAQEWAEMTTELSPVKTGPNQYNYSFIAIAMDEKVFSAPSINGPIKGGSTEISGSFTSEEAKSLANLLNAGALPAPLVIIDEAVVGPTIGAENSRSGLISFGIALALVLIYMVFYYGRAGLVADIALVMNIILIIGFLAAFGAVLTLAGIAGIVLTIGMSVDANVLIFERIREEIAEGKGMKLAVKDGYRNALSSIVDANVTTLLVAIVLKTFGTGPIESFATTLIIGIFTSVFAAVVITRLIFESQISRKKTFTFSTPVTKGAFKNINLQFIKNRKKFYIVSALLVIGGLAVLFTRGLKPSVEFAGGRTFETVFEKPVASDVEEINSLLRENLIEDEASASVEVKMRNSEYRVEISTDYMLNVPNSQGIVREEVLAALETVEDKYGEAAITNSRSVSPTISEELKQSSSVAIILSLIIIFVYILIRFGKWQYGLGAIVAMAHDVIIVLGLFALLHGVLPFNMEIDQAFIAAILTVVGYSINDTVVVFDRLREYLNKYRRKDRKEIMNVALNSTLSRTINTSLSTFIVLLTIFIFDGGAIKGFIFALMVGIIVGTYSSVCIATPIVADLVKGDKKKDDEE